MTSPDSPSEVRGLLELASADYAELTDLAWLFRVVDASADFVIASLDVPARPPKPRVVRIQFENPFHIEILGALAVVPVLIPLVRSMLTLRGEVEILNNRSEYEAFLYKALTTAERIAADPQATKKQRRRARVEADRLRRALEQPNVSGMDVGPKFGV